MPAPMERPAGGAIDAAAIRRVWDEILGYVAARSPRVRAVVREATVREVEGETLVLLFKHRVHADMLAAGPDLLVEAVYETLGPPAPDRAWQVRCELTGGGPAPAAPSPGPRSPGPAPKASSKPVPPAVSQDDGWPEAARPGGAAPSPRQEPDPAPGRRAAASRKAPAKKAAKPADEPPYDPDYDGPVRDAQYEGFDPGDEPLDDVVDEQTARRSSEEQALQLLQQTLGAEKIR
jgi:DNA polymerase III subunit gamma/tau